MKRALILVLAGLLASCSQEGDGPVGEGSTYKVYFLGGQSNMDGYGYSSDLPEGLPEDVKSVPIFHGRTLEDGRRSGGEGLWSMLRPGHGAGFETNGRRNSYSDRFGPELTFARSMMIPEGSHEIAIIKFTRGGTALVDGVSGFGSWDPDYDAKSGRNQLDYALTSIETALSAQDVDGDGAADTLIPAGIVWMQGEADAFDNEQASRQYARNLAEVIGHLRRALGNDALPVVIGQIKDPGDTPETRVMEFSPLVQEQQAAFVANDGCAALVMETENFGFRPEDLWHYRSEDYLALGTAFAGAMLELEQGC